MTPGTLSVVDAGNTAVKVVRFDPAGRVVDARRSLHGPGERSVLEGIGEGDGIAAVASSDRGRTLLREWAEALGRPVRLAGIDFPLGVSNRTLRPEETGADRLAAARGAFLRSAGPAVAVGVGTAITVDIVEGKGAFLGGAIAPGLWSSAAGLAVAAPRLPAAVLDPGRAPPALPGRTTEEALRAGVFLGFAGLIDRLVEEALPVAAGEGGNPAAVRVYFHGGDAAALGPLVRVPFVEAPHLVAEGVRDAWTRFG